jgi:hypothetical protein
MSATGAGGFEVADLPSSYFRDMSRAERSLCKKKKVTVALALPWGLGWRRGCCGGRPQLAIAPGEADKGRMGCGPRSGQERTGRDETDGSRWDRGQVGSLDVTCRQDTRLKIVCEAYVGEVR